LAGGDAASHDGLRLHGTLDIVDEARHYPLLVDGKRPGRTIRRILFDLPDPPDDFGTPAQSRRVAMVVPAAGKLPGIRQGPAARPLLREALMSGVLGGSAWATFMFPRLLIG
jgi:hypothetical protein